VLANDTGRYDDPARHYTDAITALDRVADRHHPLHAAVQHNLAGLAHSRGRFTDGEAPARRAVELRRHTPFATPTDIAADQTVLGAILAGQGRHDEAEPLGWPGALLAVGTGRIRGGRPDSLFRGVREPGR
jgi:hypothetical protein